MNDANNDAFNAPTQIPEFTNLASVGVYSLTCMKLHCNAEDVKLVCWLMETQLQVPSVISVSSASTRSPTPAREASEEAPETHRGYF